MQAVLDPIHRRIPLEPWTVDLMDSRQVQRLRRVRQLGTAHLVYPGANHTRFEHGLGAFKLAQDAARAFALDQEDARTVECAALLHDVGHGPFSHLFEEAAEAHDVHHEEQSADLIRWSGLADRLRASGVEPRRVADLVQGRGDHARIVSGDIDIDRMDYLLRDAYYTGLRVSVDPERLLDTLALHENHVVVKQDGVTAVEALLVARFLMYPAVYFHHTVRASESMVVSAVRRLLADGARVEDLRGLDDAQLLACLHAAGGYPRRIAEAVEERRLFKRAWEGTHAQAQADPFLARLSEDPAARARFEAELAHEAGLADGDVLVDAPRLAMVREVEARVLGRDGTLTALKDQSTLTRSLVTAQKDHWRFWVFAPREAVEDVARAYARISGTKRVKREPGLGRRP